MRLTLSRQQLGVVIIAGGVLFALSLGAILTYTTIPAAKIGGFTLIDGVAAGIMLALITHVRHAAVIYLCLAGFAVTLQPLFSRLPYVWFISDPLWEKLPESGVTFLGIVPTVSYLVGLVLVFTLAGYHAADPVPEPDESPASSP